MKKLVFGLVWALVLGLGADGQAQSIRLRAVGFTGEQVAVWVGQTVTVEVLADLQGMEASGFSLSVSIPDGPFQVLDADPSSAGTQPFVAGPLFSGATEFQNILLSEDQSPADVLEGRQLQYLAVMEDGPDRVRTGSGIIASFSLRCIRSVVDGALLIDDNPVLETFLVLADGGADTHFRTVQGLEITVTGISVADIPDVILRPDEADSTTIGSLDRYLENALSPVDSIRWSFEPSNLDSVSVQIDPRTRRVKITPAEGWRGQRQIVWTATEPHGLLPGEAPLSAWDVSRIVVNTPPQFIQPRGTDGVRRDTVRIREDEYPYTPGTFTNNPQWAFRPWDLDTLIMDPDILDPQHELSFAVLPYGEEFEPAVIGEDDVVSHDLLVWSRPDYAGIDSFRVVVRDQFRGEDSLRVVVVVEEVPETSGDSGGIALAPYFLWGDQPLYLAPGSQRRIAIRDLVADADTPTEDLEWMVSVSGDLMVEIVGDSLFFAADPEFSGGEVVFIRVQDPEGLSSEWALTVRAVVESEEPLLITTVAGGSVGDGLDAVQSRLNGPSGVAVDNKGNLFIADTQNNRIRRVGVDGVITTVAGNGEYGYSGDGGLATRAQLRYPSCVAVDGNGDLYIAETGGERIRRVGADGIITTIAGTGEYGYNGDGVLAIQAKLNSPSGVAVDRLGNLYIADRQNYRIRKVGVDGVITTVAGTGEWGIGGDGGPALQAQFMGLTGITVDGEGNIYIVDDQISRIRKVGSDGIITTVAGVPGEIGVIGYGGDGELAIEAPLYSPAGVALDEQGNLYIADRENFRIRRVGLDGVITTVAGTGESGYGGDEGLAVQAKLNSPSGVAVDRLGELYIADTGNHRVRRVRTDGTITTVAGKGRYGYGGDGGLATQSQLSSPLGVTVDGAGGVYIADTENHRIRKVGTDGTIITVAGTGEYGYSGDGSAATEARLARPSSVAVDRYSNLYVADTDNHCIRRVGIDGVITTVAGGWQGFYGDGGLATQAWLRFPTGVAVGAGGDLYIADRDNHRTRKVGANGIIATLAGTGVYGYDGDGEPATQAQLSYPSGVAVDNESNLYIVDTGNHSIRKVGVDGVITTVAGTGEWGFGGDGGLATQAGLYSPSGVAADREGNIYIACPFNADIRKIGRGGLITTVAGTEAIGFGGDGGLAIQAHLNFPSGLAVDGAGNLYIADTGNDRIRMVSASRSVPTAVSETAGTETIRPPQYALAQNSPNPFNPATTIQYQLPQSSQVTLEVYDLLGQPVRTLVDQTQEEGTYQVMWDGRDQAGRAVGSGIYFGMLRAGQFRQVRKMVLVR